MADFPSAKNKNQVTEDLAGAFHFLLEVETVSHGAREVIAGFNGISGGGVKVEKRDVTTGDDPHRMHQPGAIEYENITLTRGLTTNKDLLDWFQDIVEGSIDRRSGSIIVLDQAGNESRRWDFYEAYPVSLSFPELTADGSGVALEKIELAVGHTRWWGGASS
jgi:phage tail-like protein